MTQQRDSIAQKLAEHVAKLKELKGEVEKQGTTASAAANVVASPSNEMEELRRQLDAMREESMKAMAKLKADYVADIQRARQHCAALTSERDALQVRYSSADLAPEVIITDSPTFEQEVVNKQQEMAAARDAHDAEEYGRLTEEHAKVVAALAQAMRQRLGKA